MKKDVNRRKESYRLHFYGLSDGEHELFFELEETFFVHSPFDDIRSNKLRVDVSLVKTQRHLRLNFDFTGTVEVECGLSLEYFWMPMHFQTELLVKFGESYSFDDHEVWIVDRAAHHVDLADYFYETVIVNLPQRRVNPAVEEGELDSPVYQAYQNYVHQQEEKVENEPAKEEEPEDIDPRWSALKKLKKDK
jgi:uncharacterized metal-binding protein YceD (DUF177 family)